MKSLRATWIVLCFSSSLFATIAFGDPAGSAPTPATPVPPAPTMARADSAKSMEDNVRTAVVDSESRIGKLEPWQKKLFDEEVVPQSQKFVRGFSGTSALVDVDSIRNYLRFYGPEAFHGANHKILVYFRSASGCAACAFGRDRIQAMLKARLERRGLDPIWLTPEEAEGQGITGSPQQISDRVVAAARAQGDNAALTVLIDPVPVDDLDSAHADEKHYMVRANLDLRDIAREEGHIDVLDPEPFDGALARLMNDAFTDAGIKLAQAPDAGGAGGNEIRIEVRGAGDYATYARSRDALADKLRADGSLEEREISRNHAVFALVTNRSPASVRKELGRVSIENGSLALVPGGDAGHAPASSSLPDAESSAGGPGAASDASSAGNPAALASGSAATAGAGAPDEAIVMEIHP